MRTTTVNWNRLAEYLRLLSFATLTLALALGISNIATAYDFSGGYTSSRVIGVTGGNILTIGGASSSALDVGASGEEANGNGNGNGNGADIGSTLLNTLLPTLLAAVIIVFAFRTGNPIVMLLGVIIGITAFVVVQNLLELL